MQAQPITFINLYSLADQGSAVLIISQDLDEILSLCEQIHVLSEGSLSDAVDMKKDGLEKISQLMVGGESNDKAYSKS